MITTRAQHATTQAEFEVPHRTMRSIVVDDDSNGTTKSYVTDKLFDGVTYDWRLPGATAFV